MSLLFQREWLTYQKNAWAGMVSSTRASMIIRGQVATPANGITPRPGYPVFYNETAGRYEVPNTDANIQRTCGILVYRKSDIANSSGVVEYEDNTAADILIQGTIWVTAGAAINPHQGVVWDEGDTDFIARTAIAVTAPTAIAPATDVADASVEAEINTAVDSVITNAQATVDSLLANTNAALASFGYTRLTCIAPVAIAAGDLFEIYLSGGSIY